MTPSDHAAPQRTSSIHTQIYARLRAMIESGQLRPGERVSSLRAMAVELGVARGTVQLAYDRLLGEGYLVARGPAGTFVADHAARPEPPRRARALASSVVAPAKRHATAPGAEGLIESGGGAPLMLQLGVPALDAFPRKLWARLMARQVRLSHALTKPAPAGYTPLREALASYLYRSRGMQCNASQLFVVPAYAAGLELTVQALALAEPGGHIRDSKVWVENPGFPPTAQSLRHMGLRPHLVPVDEHGLDVDHGRQHCIDAKLAVVTPSHQSPTGVALTLARRMALLDWAATHDAWIVEDDYDGEYRYRGHPLPALKSLDTHERVIYAGTLSKVLFPGLRLAYVVVPQALVTYFEIAAARAAYGGCPEMMQAAVAEFITEGHFSRHIKRMRTLYARRRVLLAEALRPYEKAGFAVRLEDGGMHLLLDVPPDRDDAEMAQRARTAGFGIHALTAWRRGEAGRRALILGFTNLATAADATRQVAMLMQVLTDVAPVGTGV